MSVVWNVYVVIAVVAFSVSWITIAFLLGVHMLDEYEQRKRYRKMDKDLRELAHEEETRRYLDRLFNDKED